MHTAESLHRTAEKYPLAVKNVLFISFNNRVVWWVRSKVLICNKGNIKSAFGCREEENRNNLRATATKNKILFHRSK